MAVLTYQKIVPRARSGITGLSVEQDLDADGVSTGWISPPERIATLTIAVHKQHGYSGDIRYKIECCCNETATIGTDGTGGYWDPIDGRNAELDVDRIYMLTNSVTGVRVVCLEGKINVCFCS